MLDALAHGHRTFSQLLIALPGVYPSVVRAALSRLARTHTLPASLAHSWELPISSAHDPGTHSVVLPPPHPLDYDWRFSDAGVDVLLDACCSLAGRGDRIALLGTPSVLQAAGERQLPYRFALLEANPTSLAAFLPATPHVRVVPCDLTRDPLPALLAKVVVTDPPWYEEHIRSFLWAARRLCAPGGAILISLPPPGTRPAMAAEWERTLRWTMQLGLTLVRLAPGAITYQTPLFEHNALRAEGFSVVPPHWRRGDLAIFQCVQPCAAPRPPLPASKGLWDSITLGGTQIRLRQQHSMTFTDPSLRTLVDGDVLPSVSRRDPRRKRAAVWTTGNRIFACRGTHVLKCLAQAIRDEQTPRDGVSAMLGRPLHSHEARLVDKATQQVYRLVAHELRDMQDVQRSVRDEQPLSRHRC